MAIYDCGCPPLTAVPGTDPVQHINGSRLLVFRGPTIPVEIGFHAGLFETDPAKVQAALAQVQAQQTEQLVGALIDTGATESCIDEELAQALNLPIIDKQKGSGIGGTEEFNVYLGHIRIAALGFVQYGRFMGVRLKAGQQFHQALLGRSLLAGMILVYDGRDGSVRLAN